MRKIRRWRKSCFLLSESKEEKGAGDNYGSGKNNSLWVHNSAYASNTKVFRRRVVEKQVSMWNGGSGAVACKGVFGLSEPHGKGRERKALLGEVRGWKMGTGQTKLSKCFLWEREREYEDVWSILNNTMLGCSVLQSFIYKIKTQIQFILKLIKHLWTV